MRRELFSSPHLLAQRVADELTRRHRLRRLRGTAAQGLEYDHIDSLELLERVQATVVPRVIYDIGGNRGTWSLLARTLCPAAEVHAFEPLEDLHEDFVGRTASVGRTTLHGVALGADARPVPMYVHAFADASSILPLSETEAARWPHHLREVRVVPQDTLDNYVASHGLPEPDLVKADVQGYELEVFRGAPRVLAHARAVIAEVSFIECYAGQPLFGEVASFLERAGFRTTAFAHGFPRPGAPLVQTDVLFTRA